MNLFELFVKVGVDDQASGKIGALSQKLGNGLKTAAKIGTAAVSVAAAGITVADQLNRTRGNYGYTIIEVKGAIGNAAQALQAVDGVIRVLTY